MSDLKDIIKTILDKIERIERVSGYQQQQINNMIRFGYIEAVEDIDYENHKVRVRLSENFKTGWLIFTPERAGKTSSWNPPDVGENVLIISPYGELLQGIVIKSVYSSPFPAPGSSPDQPVEKIGDKISVIYDRESGTITLNCENFQVNCKKASISNQSGEVIALAAQALQSISDSKTDTMKGPNPLLPGSVEVPKVVTNLKTFSGSANTEEAEES